MISFEDFKKMDIKVAKVKDVKDHPNADKLLVLTVEVGREGGGQPPPCKTMVAGIKGHYSPGELVGKLIVIIDNLEPATIRGVRSEAMLLAARDRDSLCLVVPDKTVAPGSPVS